jgi:hypothetical protein
MSIATLFLYSCYETSSQQNYRHHNPPIVNWHRTTEGSNMAFFRKRNLRSRDDQRTRAAELTLRESIYPLMLVTILFFLWVNNTPPLY